MEFKEYKSFELGYNLNYKSCEFLIEKIIEKFKAKVDLNAGDSFETMYCDLLIKGEYKVCIYYHYILGIEVIALTKDSEPTAKEVADFMDAFIAGWIANKKNESQDENK